MRYGKKLLLLPLILISLVIAYTSISFSQVPTPSNYDVTVSPVFFDLSANPGDSLGNKIRFRNNTTSPLPIKITVQKMTGDVNGDLTLRDDRNDTSLSWIKFSEQTFIAKPLEWTDVPFTINVPKDAAYGYYFAVSFTQDNTSPIKRTGTTITGAAAVPILLDVKKAGAKAQAKIVDFSADNYVSEYLPVNFSVKVENQGNIHVSPHGNIFINEGNQPLASLDVNPTLGNIIPGTNKTLVVPWSDGFLVREPIMEGGQPKLDKNGKPLESIAVNWNKLTEFRIGRYTANLLLVYDNGTRDVPLEANVSFWVFPWKVVGLLITSLILLIVLSRFLLKSYINRELKKRLAK
jgi:hypothetical protein